LIEFRGRPLVSYALDALRWVAAGRILISANRHLEKYAAFGHPVITDANGRSDGPLAGLLAAMRAADTEYVLAVPCDCPLMTGPLLSRIVDRMVAESSEVCAASDGIRLQPVFVMVQRRLSASLETYLACGERKFDQWLKAQRLSLADYGDCPDVFANVNSPQDLSALERQTDDSFVALPSA
jgi:molybdopterin-guanine dinucleotide biosynthesis protein A